MDGGLILTIQIVSGIFTAFIMFWVHDIKNSIDKGNDNFLKHSSSLDLHCSREKFKINHIVGG